VPFGQVWCEPAVPDRLLPLRVERLHLAGAKVTIEVDADRWRMDGLPGGVELIRAARRPLTAATPVRAAPGTTG